MTLILRGAYTHYVHVSEAGVLSTDCGAPVGTPVPVFHVEERQAVKAVDCPDCLRARIKEEEGS